MEKKNRWFAKGPIEDDSDRMTFKDIIACIIAQYMILAPIVFGAVIIMFLLLFILTRFMK